MKLNETRKGRMMAKKPLGKFMLGAIHAATVASQTCSQSAVAIYASIGLHSLKDLEKAGVSEFDIEEVKTAFEPETQ